MKKPIKNTSKPVEGNPWYTCPKCGWLVSGKHKCKKEKSK